MKTLSLFVLASTSGAAVAFLTGYISLGATLVALGITAIAAADYGTTRKPLVPVEAASKSTETHPLAA